MDSDYEMYQIQWRDHLHILPKALYANFVMQKFVDVTLTCQGQSIKCHRVVLSACSTFFDSILCANPDPNLIIYLNDMEFWQVVALVTFVYSGEVSICRRQFSSFCKAAEALKVNYLLEVATITGSKRVHQQDEDDLQDVEISNPKEKILRQPTRLVKGPRIEKSSGGADADTSTPQQILEVNRMPTNKKRGATEKASKLPMMTESKINGNIKEVSDAVGRPKRHVKKVQDAVKAALGTKMDLRRSPKFQSQKKETRVSKKPALRLRAPVNDKDHTERLKKAAELAVNTSVRAAAAQYEIPRSTLFFYMRRHGLKSAYTLASRQKLHGKKVHDAVKPALAETKKPLSPSSKFQSQKKETRVPKKAALLLRAPVNAKDAPPVQIVDSKERLKKAAELAVMGDSTTVRAAAAQYEIPRSTLVAYMKRHGLKSAYTLARKKPAENPTEDNEESTFHSRVLPFSLGLSELMNDDVGQEAFTGEGWYMNAIQRCF